MAGKSEIFSSKHEKTAKGGIGPVSLIDQFNSFYPMEIIATKEEVDKIVQKNSGSDYLLFPEARENSIRMTSDIPYKWISDGITNLFQGRH